MKVNKTSALTFLPIKYAQVQHLSASWDHAISMWKVIDENRINFHWESFGIFLFFSSCSCTFYLKGLSAACLFMTSKMAKAVLEKLCSATELIHRKADWVQILLIFGDHCNRFFWDIQLKMYKLHNIYVLWVCAKIIILKLFFWCLHKVDPVSNWCKSPISHIKTNDRNQVVADLLVYWESENLSYCSTDCL